MVYEVSRGLYVDVHIHSWMELSQGLIIALPDEAVIASGL